MAEIRSSERLKQDIAEQKITELRFSDKKNMVEWLHQYGQSDITEADVPFDGSISFLNDEYIDLFWLN